MKKISKKMASYRMFQFLCLAGIVLCIVIALLCITISGEAGEPAACHTMLASIVLCVGGVFAEYRIGLLKWKRNSLLNKIRERNRDAVTLRFVTK